MQESLAETVLNSAVYNLPQVLILIVAGYLAIRHQERAPLASLLVLAAMGIVFLLLVVNVSNDFWNWMPRAVFLTISWVRQSATLLVLIATLLDWSRRNPALQVSNNPFQKPF